MIAPNDNPKPGRNDPCPCGSGAKFKLCCGDEEIKKVRQENVRMRVLAHIALMQLHKLTRSPAILVPDGALKDYPADCEIKMVHDKIHGVFLFSAVPPKEQVINAPRRLLLPNRG